MIDYSKVLRQLDSTWCVEFKGSAQEATGCAYKWSDAGFTVRIVRGQKMRQYQGLFDEFAAALQFPWYFGENGNAFDECISDLSWLQPLAGYVLVIMHSADTLADTEDDGLTWLVRSLSDAATEFARSTRAEGRNGGAPVAFHIVLQFEEADANVAQQRWAAAGASIGIGRGHG